MDCMEAQLKMQAVLDNELDEKEIPAVMTHMEGCYPCRQEYIEFLRLQRRLSGASPKEPPKEWFEQLEKQKFRKGFRRLGFFFFIGSYLLLLGYFLFQFFTDGTEALAVRILSGGILAGAAILIIITLSDRLKESRDDKYKGVMK
ncbi:MAG: zf-HC2 domain-containing protein [Spirochaetales bacterium]|nr:zf-HC2 domain-containing protein [Spirochaetales bacterium]